MPLARDEVIGLVVAAAVGVAALADFAYRRGKATAGPSATAPAGPVAVDPQAPRTDFAAALQEAFAADHAVARVTAEATTLRIQWTDCSKPMLHRLVHDEKNFQVLNIREQSGLTAAKLKALGFTKIVCTDPAGKQFTEQP